MSLRHLGAEVIGLGRRNTGATDVAMDLLLDDPTTALGAADADVLLHLAWTTEHGAYRDDPSNLDWVDATMRLAKSFVDAGGRRIVFASTCVDGEPSLYGRSKHDAGQRLAALGAATGVTVATARIHYLYGPGEHEGRLVPMVIRAALAGSPIRLRTPHQVIDLLEVSDVGRALAATCVSDVSGQVDIASGVGVTIGRVAEEVVDIVPGATIEAERLPLAPSPPVIGDPTVLADATGFSPRVRLEDGLVAAVSWWRQR